MRTLGLDYGSKTCGVAISDPFGWTAQGLETITRKNEKDLVSTINRLKEIITGYSIDTIVLGLPKNMNNTEGERVEKTLVFKRRLEREFGINVLTWDERLSTMGAQRLLIEADVHKKKHKKVIDKMAAVFILQGYLDANQ
ncbi:MAG: Holliday junction resolvase RuvX [Firmicutes bacterium HGW-Firmicutes-1]|jgi:putative Holliday junction resolvase|nr:MAG: Holliday junction resolvase RuvX [Firmicutes bacterium HGW-Firmicutes-1]